MNNFYLITGNIDRIRKYLNRQNFEELQGVSDATISYTVIATKKKLFWTVDKTGLKVAKNIIKHQLGESYTEYSFDHFKKDYSLTISENYTDSNC